MTRDEFVDWKNSLVTQEIFGEIEKLIKDGRDELEATAGINSIQDAKNVGKIKALRDILDISFEGN